MRNQFKEIVSSTIYREGIDALMNWLENETDFYYAPASSKFHGAYQGGLLLHSLNVYKNLKMLNELYELGYPEETISIVSLFHDLCKTNYYKFINNKISVYDSLPLEHGHKSIILLQRFINLTDEECLAIAFHMSGWSPSAKVNDSCYGNATNRSKLVTLLQMADLASTFIVEA